MINLGIIFGGQSVEHDISIITFNQVVNGINRDKYNIIPLYLDKNNVLWRLSKFDKLEYFKGEKIKGAKLGIIKKNEKGVFVSGEKIDIVLCTCHGKDLENGVISGLLKFLNVPNTIPNVYVSSTFHNKYITKILLKENKIPSLNYYYITKDKWESEQVAVTKNVFRVFGERMKIIKPVSLGSSIGIKKCLTKEEFKKAIEECLMYDDAIIVEEVLENFLELNQACYKAKDEIILSKIEEVKNENDFYGFEEKYESEKVKRIIPAKIDNGLKTKINKTSKKIYEIFSDIGVMRVDYLYDLDKEKLYVNEINVIPGALSYYLFEAKDIYFDKLLDDLISEGVRRKNKERELILSFKSDVLNFNKGKK